MKNQAQIIQQHGKTFYWASFFLEKTVRSRLFSIYAFCIKVDDIVDTAGTLCGAAKALKAEGAKKVLAYITHPVLSGKAYEKIKKSMLDEIVVTDTIPLHEKAKKISNIRQISVSEMLAETIRRIHQGESVSTLFMD